MGTSSPSSASPLLTFSASKKGLALDWILGGLTFAGILASLYLALVFAESEKVMGAVQRIFYFHVGAANAVYLAAAVMLVGNLAFLATYNRMWDSVARAGSEVALVFATIVMATGMIWADTIWNTPFVFEPRLVTFLILWLLLAAIEILRAFGDPDRIPQHAAVLGLFAAVTVPAVWYSINLLPESQQIHPQVVARSGLKDASYYYALFGSLTALAIATLFFCWITTRLHEIARVLTFRS